ncbi:MAG: FadR/GntR family transcriptional regulator [Terriglobales bacterium]
MATTVKPEFENLRRGKIYEEVARQIQQRIVQEMQPGDVLPAERELAQQFGVSRSSIRDAIRSLETMGLLEPRQGMGTVVKEVSADSLVGTLTSVLLQKRKVVHELLDVRQILEPALTARAAEHITSEQLKVLEELLERQGEKIRGGELAMEEDSEFHSLIAAAARNTVILQVLDVLMGVLRETRERSLQSKGRLQKSFAGHRRILAALKRHDARAAEAAMRRHLQEIEAIVIRELS